MSIDYEAAVKKYTRSYLNNYRKLVEVLYPEAIQENPEAFKLLVTPDELDYFLVLTDDRYENLGSYFFLYSGTGMFTLINELNESDYKESKKFDRFESYLINKISKDFDKDAPVESILNNLTVFLWTLDTDDAYKQKIVFEDIGRLTKRSADSHARVFIQHINHSSSYYAKHAYKYVYSDLDFSHVVDIVKDSDFEYALNESLAAYDASLYLAASATAGTALENLIVKMIEHSGIPYSENQSTELGYLVNTLKSNRIINKKMKQRIMNAASLRNLASHANKGRTIREDAKSIYQTIYTLASEYFVI